MRNIYMLKENVPIKIKICCIVQKVAQVLVVNKRIRIYGTQ